MSVPDRVTLNLRPRAVEAVASAMELDGENLTDTINKAVLLYWPLLQAARGGASITITYPDQSPERLMLL